MPLSCPKCNMPNEDLAKECQYCGEPLEPRVAPSARESRAPSASALVLHAQGSRNSPGLLRGRYRIQQQVVRRRVSAVYRAQDEQTGDWVAIKRLDTLALVTPADRRTSMSEFERLARQLSTLSHPNLVRIRDHFTEPTAAYVVMDWVEGEALRDRYHRGPMDDAELRDVGLQIADALSFLHLQQPPIVFCDLKMSHIMVDEHGHVTLLDLGVSRFFKPGQSNGAYARGTAPYEAPEQAMYGYVSPKSDIYALGTLLLALAKGPAGTASARQLPPDLQHVLTVARQRDPDKRFSTMKVMLEALRAHQIPVPRKPRTATRPTVVVLTGQLRIVRQPGKSHIGYVIRLRNDARDPISVSVKSTLAWLKPREAQIELPPQSVSKTIVQANLDAMAKGVGNVPKAVLIQAEDGTRVWIPAVIEEPEPRIEVRPLVLDFGHVNKESAVQHLHVRNAGGGVLEGRIVSTYEWLTPLRGTFSLSRGQEDAIPVRLDSARAPANGEHPQALRIDTDLSQESVGVRFSRGVPRLLVDRSEVAFGTVSPSAGAQAQLTIVNRGSATTTVSVKATHNAVSVQPTRIELAPGKRAPVTVTLATQSLPPGELSLGNAVIISASGTSHTVAVRATVRRPLLALSESAIEFGPVEASKVEASQQHLILSNRGNAPLQFTIRVNAPWLTVWPSEGKLNPGGSTIVDTSLRQEKIQSPGTYSDENALTIDSDGGVVSLPSSFSLIKPLLSVQPTSLDFGIVPQAAVSEATLTVYNAGTGTLEWDAGTEATWLEVEPSSGTCPTGEHSEIVVRAYPLGLPQEARSAHAKIDFRGPYNSVSVEARITVSRPVLVVEPVLELGESLNLAPVSADLILFNRGVGELHGTVNSNIEWIAVQSAEFSIPSGSSVRIPVTAAPPPEAPVGSVYLPAALSAKSDAGDADVDVRMTIAASPKMEIAPDRLVLHRNGRATILIRNTGSGVLNATTESNVSWLQVSPKKLTVKPGKRARIQVTVNEDETAELPLEGYILVDAGPQQDQVEVILN